MLNIVGIRIVFLIDKKIIDKFLLYCCLFSVVNLSFICCDEGDG